jgi:hypothetical protein
MRITSQGPGGRLGAATLPVPARLAQGYQSWGPVVGSPGTTEITAPYPAAVPQGIRYANSGDATSFSDQAPPVWKPGFYFQPELSAPPNVSVSSDNQMPVPATLPNGQIGFVASGNSSTFKTGGANLLRQRQVGWPITTPSFRWANS